MDQPLFVAFLWHMHQPYYRDGITGACPMPWVRLHASKDYLPMVKRLEAFPSIHQTFNLVPCLVDQLEEYFPPLSRSDDFLDLSRIPAAQLTEDQAHCLIHNFFMANEERMIKPHPRYYELLMKRGRGSIDREEWPRLLRRFNSQDLLDLQVWFNLTWVDPGLRNQDSRLAQLEQKGARFTEQEKAGMLQAQLNLVSQVIPAYRQAAERGQIELTTSPYYHPILPLLCDLKVARMALPQVVLPEAIFQYSEDARWQLDQALQRHASMFGRLPNGMWPSEGSVSEDVVALVMDAGIRWIATDEDILWRTLKTTRSASFLYRPHRLVRQGREMAVVFRDRELSDLFGFVYSHWQAQQAITDFIHRLGAIHQQVQSFKHPALVSIILDGENAWEHYPENGGPFLTGLYKALASDSRFRCVTVTEFLEQISIDQFESLPELFAGSWIESNFATWIGHPEKNEAWTQLVSTRAALAASVSEPVRKSLGMAEGSDWFWWFGDTHISQQASVFDQIFRTHLANSYRLSGLEVPTQLKRPIRQSEPQTSYGPMALIHPTIDGRESSYYEWFSAGVIELTQVHASMHHGTQRLRRICYGFDEQYCYIRVDAKHQALTQLDSWKLEIFFTPDLRVWISQDEAAKIHVSASAPSIDPLPCALHQFLELAVPQGLLNLKEGKQLGLTLTLFQKDQQLEHYPQNGVFDLMSSVSDSAIQAWSA